MIRKDWNASLTVAHRGVAHPSLESIVYILFLLQDFLLFGVPPLPILTLDLAGYLPDYRPCSVSSCFLRHLPQFQNEFHCHLTQQLLPFQVPDLRSWEEVSFKPLWNQLLRLLSSPICQ